MLFEASARDRRLACGVHVCRQAAAVVPRDRAAVAVWQTVHIGLCDRLLGRCPGSHPELRRFADGMGGQGAQDATREAALHGENVGHGSGVRERAQGLLIAVTTRVCRSCRGRGRGGPARLSNADCSSEGGGPRARDQVHQPLAAGRRVLRSHGGVAFRISQRRVALLQVRGGRQPGAAADARARPREGPHGAPAARRARLARGQGVAFRRAAQLGKARLPPRSAVAEVAVGPPEVRPGEPQHQPCAQGDRRLVASRRLGLRRRQSACTTNHPQHRGAELRQEPRH
mmetsp:Transcript_8558/g.21506  ORF Transcript_8558/g.21506 Transcript_8558/m.21506 type:complete len:286 (+) Transcript_8558:93-950(+)